MKCNDRLFRKKWLDIPKFSDNGPDGDYFFMNNNIIVHLIELADSDPSELGKSKILEMIKASEPLTFSRLMGYKLYANG